MVIDICLFNGEYDLLEIRLNILNEYVDEFVICEAPKTFSGKQKPLYFQEQKDRYAPFLHKIKYFVIDTDYSQEEIDFAKNHPSTEGLPHWCEEFCQKESFKKAMTHLNDTDICFVSDVDEIWNPEQALKWLHAPFKYKLKVYSYFLNNSSDEQFWGTLVSPYKHIKNDCLNHLRTSAWKTEFYAGWHFTNMGDVDFLKRKIESYGHQEYNTDGIKSMIASRLHNNRDYIGRNFTFIVNETDLPEYILENKEKYSHLWKKN